MDKENQQVTEKRLAWLGGIWDGEGTFSIVKQNKKRGIVLQAKATMENTDVAIVAETCKILDELDIKCYLWFRERKTDRHKDAYVINICRYDQLDKFCRIILPYLIAKDSRAEIVARFVKSRLTTMAKHGKDHNEMGHSEIEKTLCEQLSVLNKFGKSDTSTTLREKFEVQETNKKRWLN